MVNKVFTVFSHAEYCIFRWGKGGLWMQGEEKGERSFRRPPNLEEIAS
jgi:hypothetical protein